MITAKENVHQHFLDLVQTKINVLQQKLDDLQESLKGETKSTAGDKHETARAFVHIEQENTGRQLAEMLQQKAALESCAAVSTKETIVTGSLVQTNRGYFYIVAGLGKANINGEIVFALSPVSPLGQQLIGATLKETIEVHTTKYTIEAIL